MLIAVTGLSGAGKSTALEHLEQRGFGVVYYAGEALQTVIRERGLPITPANERSVRTELRRDRGMPVFADLAIMKIVDLAKQDNVLLDALYCSEERDCYASEFGTDLVVMSVLASQETRIRRLAIRPDRPMGADDLRRRDELEIRTLGIEQMMSTAHEVIENEGTLDEFKRSLDALAGRLCH